MTFGRRDLKAINGALIRAIEWEEGIVEAYSHMKEDPQYAKAKRSIERFKRVRMKVFAALNLNRESNSSEKKA